MTEAEWADENPPPSKKIVPTWLWFCGGGCLIAVVLGVVALLWVVDAAKELTDESIQWPAIGEFIEVDEQPETLDFLGKMPVVGVWMFMDTTNDFMLMLYHFEGKDAEQTREQLLNEEFDGSFMGMGGRKDLEAGRVTVQGREVDAMRFYQQSGGPQQGEVRAGQSAIVEITPENEISDQFLAIQLIRIGPGEEITDEEIQDMLEPFHVGPDRK